MVKIFFDTEFTGLHQNTTLISIGLISEDGKEFYAEFTDYDKSQVNDWIRDNVIQNLICEDDTGILGSLSNPYIVRGDTQFVSQELSKWLANFESVEMWSDCLAYDWVLFNQLWGHAFNIPGNVYYIPFDLSTMLRLYGIDADINREQFSGLQEDDTLKHNAAWDAKVIKACYEKLVNIRAGLVADREEG